MSSDPLGGNGSQRRNQRDEGEEEDEKWEEVPDGYKVTAGMEYLSRCAANSNEYRLLVCCHGVGQP